MWGGEDKLRVADCGSKKEGGRGRQMRISDCALNHVRFRAALHSTLCRADCEL